MIVFSSSPLKIAHNSLLFRYWRSVDSLLSTALTCTLICRKPHPHHHITGTLYRAPLLTDQDFIRIFIVPECAMQELESPYSRSISVCQVPS